MADEEETCPNPLLLGWVKGWLDKAREQNSKGITTYRNAYQSLKACPIVLDHPSQVKQLKGFGDKLAERLTEKMNAHCQENGLPLPARKRSAPGAASGDPDDPDQDPKPSKKPRTAKPYVPKLNSGPYALLLGLATVAESDNQGLTKQQLIEVAQPHCDASFTAPPDPKSFYTAWNSMKTLLSKELVQERGRLKRYLLTDEGWDVAKRIQKTLDNDQVRPNLQSTEERPGNVAQAQPQEQRPSHTLADSPEPANPPSNSAELVTNGEAVSHVSELPRVQPIRINPGSFTVHLVLDNREVRAKTDRDYFQEELAKKGVRPIVRPLEVGDVTWVAKCHDPSFLSSQGSEGDEVVLDYIVERKRLDDLIGSIRDGRFHEQKFRLNKSGVKNVIYIVEECSIDSRNFDHWEASVQSAMASSQVVNGYFLKKTQMADDTIRYLTRMTMTLKRKYEANPLFVIPTRDITAQNYLPLLRHLRLSNPGAGYYISYPAFASLASKSDLTLRDLFLKMLMTTKQVTGEKALEIQRKWRTPHDFVQAFERCGEGDAGDKKKRDLVFGQLGQLYGRKKITRQLSHKIAEVWGDA